MTDLIHLELDRAFAIRPRIDYAPGPYLNFCVLCNAEFRGHLLAVRCARCASVEKGGDAQQAPSEMGSAVPEGQTPRGCTPAIPGHSKGERR